MQNKGVIRLFAIVFALACIYQLSFTYVGSSVVRDAEAYAGEDLEKKEAYLDSINSEVVYDIGVKEYTYADVKEKEINLGLDLKGGMNVIMEVSVKDILINLSKDKENNRNAIFLQTLKQADAREADGQDDYLTFFFEEFEKVKAEKGSSIKLSDKEIFGTKELNDKLGFNAEDEAVKAELTDEVNAAVENVYTVLRARIDQFGVVQPNIQRLDNAGRILVELPGVKDPDRVKKLLVSTAKLEFWTLYHSAEMLPFMQLANDKLRSIVENPRANQNASGTDSTSANGEAAPVEDLNFASVEESNSNQDSSSIDELASSVDSLTSSLDSISQDSVDVFNPLWEIFGANFDRENGRYYESPVLGYATRENIPTINSYLEMPEVKNLLKGNERYTKFLWTAKPIGDNLYGLLAIQADRNQRPVLEGDAVTDADQDFDQNNRAYISMSMNAQGAKKWRNVTKEASSQNPKRSVAVVLDSLIYSYPRVNGEIPNGQTSIEGDFTVQEAQDLANILKAGKLPAPAKIIQADVVGPSLGKEAIQAGMWSFIIALGIVMIYMIFYYSSAGSASVVALLVNMFFIFGVLASLGAVLTLPGIAGIVLTIGMAVDANVLIYERIREELNNGKGLKLAIKDGYSNAYSSIIDANVTTFLTGVILLVFGTGPIQGFATTLIIGILTSLFCAIFITRLIFEWRLGKSGKVSFSTSATKNAFKNFTIDFLAKRKIAYIISGAIIAGGIVSLSTKGLDQGVDFVGGRSYQVRFDQDVTPTDIRQSLGALFLNEDGQQMAPSVKTIGEDNQVIITTKYKIDDNGPELESEIKAILYEGTKSFFAEVPSAETFNSEQEGSDIGIVAERQVGPTIADDIRTSALWAIIGSLIVIFLYILIRFSKWQFSLGAVAAAFHDVLIVLSVFSMLYGILPFSLEIDQAFIAAVLTVIGYSLNDTVVVFDRIREYLGIKNKKTAMTTVVNEALNSTLSRTINTSLTTFFVLLVIFIFGGEVIQGFMFALLVGVVVGTYSSLFIATPLMMDTLSKTEKREED